MEREDLDFARITKAFGLNKPVLMLDLNHALVIRNTFSMLIHGILSLLDKAS
jgi:hypothetical protein